MLSLLSGKARVALLLSLLYAKLAVAAAGSISASPLIMGNDMRNVSAASLAILKNKHAIAVSQDELGQMGIRLTPDIPQQVWARVLANGDVAVALYNKGDAAPPKQPPIPHGNCPKWTATKDGYYEAAGGPAGNVGSFSGLTVAQAQKACCNNPKCAGFSFKGGSGFYKGNALAGFVNDGGYSGYYKPNQIGKWLSSAYSCCTIACMPPFTVSRAWLVARLVDSHS